MMPAPRMPSPRIAGPDITMWNNADGRWMAHLFYNGVYSHSIRDTHDEAHDAAVKFWREHTAAGKAASR